MPITDFRFEDGIFHSKELGRVTEADATAWATAAATYATSSPYPIVALVDATEATYVTASARRIFARASGISNLHFAAIAASDFLVVQNSKLIGIMAIDRHTRVFDSLDEATEFALSRARLLRNTSSQSQAGV